MADFYQTGVVATFHRLGRVNLEKIEAELTWYAQERPIALVLPSLYSRCPGRHSNNSLSEGIAHAGSLPSYVGPPGALFLSSLTVRYLSTGAE
jgi:hypothetical protein